MFIVFLSLGLVCTRPFDIYADYLDGEFDNNSVVGVQVEEYEEELSGVQGTRYRFNIILDGFYVGNFNIHVEYDSYNVTSADWDHYTINRTVYVCGYETYFETWMRSNWLPPSSITWSASINNSDQCLYVGRMESQQLLNLLISIRSTINTYDPVMVSYLSSIDSKIDDIVKAITKQNIDPDSLNAWGYFLNYLDFGKNSSSGVPYWYQLTDTSFLNINYPFMKIGVGENTGYDSMPITNAQRVYPLSDNSKVHEMTFVCWFLTRVVLTESNISNYITVNNSSSFNVEYIRLNQSASYYVDGQAAVLYLWKIHITPKFTSGSVSCGINMKSLWNDNLIFGYISPVYLGNNMSPDTSVDFALRYRLKNSLLDNINTIANGTTQSNNSVSNLEDMNDDYNDVSQQVFGLENNFSTGFDSSMQNVPTTFNFGTQFGNKFLATATWVRNQFDTMTTNTPFGALITFSLVLGLALLIVGRRLL